ncbi:hypothetical protein GPLA_4398 [Paraglaciecola polaris LMG 21857]|uniref:Uncharacterized protein n=1 Tax=Paraglaciecola polaris LMG 21857 TaxID=1129793 RepID=K6ZYI3_9ALTE|nr:hypothetical protein GPLA_4398 [Paraglaciecola polaris LMG 21857]
MLQQGKSVGFTFYCDCSYCVVYTLPKKACTIVSGLAVAE